MVAAVIVAQGASLATYALLFRRVLASLGSRLSIQLAVQVTMAAFLVGYLTPFGSAIGTLLDASTPGRRRRRREHHH